VGLRSTSARVAAEKTAHPVGFDAKGGQTFPASYPHPVIPGRILSSEGMPADFVFVLIAGIDLAGYLRYPTCSAGTEIIVGGLGE